MKAAVLSAPGELEVRDVDDAACPEGGALVRVEACAICPSDIKMFRVGHRDLTYPRILGHEAVGRIIESDDPDAPSTGTRVQIWPGLVCGACPSCLSGNDNMCSSQGIFGFNRDGGFAELMGVPHECVGNVNTVPDDIDADVAALTEPLACCVHAQDLCGAAEGDDVLIYGAGPMGLLHAMLASARGARPFVVEPLEERREFARQLGAEVLEPSGSVADEVMSLTAGRGADVAMLATPAVQVADAMKAMAPRGRVCVFSGFPKNNAAHPLDMNQLHYRELTLVGAYGCTSRSDREALRLIASGAVDAGRLITMRTCLERLKDGFRHIEGRDGLKCVITRF